MKKLLFLFLLFPFLSHADSFDDPKALQMLEKGKVWVDVSFSEGEKSATAKFRAWIPYPPEVVWKVFIHTNAYKAMHKDFKDSQTLDEATFLKLTKKPPQTLEEFYQQWDKKKVSSFHGRQEGGMWTSYAMQHLNLPWPFKDRWNILKIKNDESKSDQGKYRYDYQAYAGNFNKLEGYWELFPVKDKKKWTEFRGQYEANTGIKLPKFITKSAMKSSMKQSVKEKTDFIENFENEGK